MIFLLGVAPAQAEQVGFSLMLVAVGGVPDLGRIGPYCAGHLETFVCTVFKAHPIPNVGSDQGWIADPRIKAAVIAAPGISHGVQPGRGRFFTATLGR